MSEIPTAADLLAAIDTVDRLAASVEHLHPSYTTQRVGLKWLREHAARIDSDRALGAALVARWVHALSSDPVDEAALGHAIRGAVLAAGGRIEFGDGVVDAQVLAGYVLARRHPDGTMWVDGEVWPDSGPLERKVQRRSPGEGYAVYELREVPAEPPTGHTAPAIDTQDQAPDAGRDVYDEIRAQRAKVDIPVIDAADPLRGVHELAHLASANCRDAVSELPFRERASRAQLVFAAALLVTAIEVIDRG